MRAEIEPFHAIAISRLAHQLKMEGRSIIHMEFGQPSTGAPSKAIAKAHEILDSEAMGYWESPLLRQRIAERYQALYGAQVEPERIVLTCGASPALVLALSSVFEPGDRIAIARPGYVAYRNSIKALHLTPVEIACGPEDRFQLTAKHLAELEPAPAGVIVASPANPTGTIIAPEELEAIARVCRERGVRIISDEIYHGLSYTGRTPSMLEFAPDALIVNSFSKYFSMAGWRLGWLLTPKGEDLERARAYVGNLFLTAPSLSQHAGLAAMDCIDELEGHIDVYRANRELMLEALPGLGLRKIAPPDGAFYIWADIGHLTDDSLSFCKQLLKDTGVCTAPGVDFDPVEGNRFIRFSFAVSTAEVEEALRRITPWFAARAAN
ncbi:pyridoxal phosphate-dependent aminotransferase [Caulobacter sp.]|uniref:pyridoxal phosphate-dependent aminotransferase n=1 Tax=Caulobacter sp. TaxID=78 RepID=UPI002B46D2AF|nr:aminotransferase class I/II-fold pyridoxal phosphate-dependent enzyme [Caulobacter sp.]HJV41055.1 aminotransferase class I/II-fold pyridoxal phosphate-dependent enzyme [Caulobacter sp.]